MPSPRRPSRRDAVAQHPDADDAGHDDLEHGDHRGRGADRPALERPQVGQRAGDGAQDDRDGQRLEDRRPDPVRAVAARAAIAAPEYPSPPITASTIGGPDR